MDEVQATGESIVVTKRGKPVGTFVPIGDEPAPRRKLGGLAAITRIHGDIVQPIGAVDDWDWEWAE